MMIEKCVLCYSVCHSIWCGWCTSSSAEMSVCVCIVYIIHKKESDSDGDDYAENGSGVRRCITEAKMYT